LDQDALTAKVVVDVVNFYTDNSDAPGTLVSNLNLRLNATTTVIKRTLKDGVAWGKVSARNSAGLPTYYWINLAGTDLGSYSLTPGKPADTTTNNNTNNSNNSNTGSNTNTGTAATTVSGVICNTDTVNVRTAAGVGNPLATTLQRGTPVTVTEQTTVDGALWGHIQQGWVALQYVDLSAKSNTTTSNVTGGNMAGNSILTSVPSGAIAVGFVNTDSLKVRAGTGFGYAVQATLPKYTNVVVYEQVLTDGVLWVRCDQGWMVGTYLTYTGLSVTGSGTAGTVARCFYTARVRSQPGVNSPLVGYVMVNSRLEIYEQQSYSGEMWGRTSIGWISMNYVLTGDVPVA
ncbi:MAG: SH3 domain-containing protein, partial [Candidatus Faecousia sp.]|nr:SH3 domain-containing protein [Candidatus Faecousia sp.]